MTENYSNHNSTLPTQRYNKIKLFNRSLNCGYHHLCIYLHFSMCTDVYTKKTHFNSVDVLDVCSKGLFYKYLSVLWFILWNDFMPLQLLGIELALNGCLFVTQMV